MEYSKKYIGNIIDLSYDMLIKVPGYEYTNFKGKLVKVPGYEYERGSKKESVESYKKRIENAKTKNELNSILQEMEATMATSTDEEFSTFFSLHSKGLDKFDEFKEPTPKEKILSKVEKIRKQPVNIRDFTQDAIELHEFTTDMTEDYTVFHGPITRAGPFVYNKNGVPVTLYKDWDNIKEQFGKVEYLPYKLAQKDSHKSGEFGFAYNFTPNEETQQMFADIVTVKDIEDLQDIVDNKNKYHVSIGFKDHIEDGNVQIIDELDHLAGSGSEVGRCSTGGEAGKRDCVIEKKENNDDEMYT